MLKGMCSNERYVVVRLCFGNKLEYVGRVATVKDFLEYRRCCGSDPADIALQDWKPQSQSMPANLNNCDEVK